MGYEGVVSNREREEIVARDGVVAEYPVADLEVPEEVWIGDRLNRGDRHQQQHRA